MIPLIELLYPRRCVSCRKFGYFFCPKCISKLEFLPNICPVCEKQSFLGETHQYCVTRYTLNGLTSIFFYGEIMKKAIHRFKYKPYLENLTPIFTKLIRKNLNRKMGLTYFLKKKPVFVPIPLHFWKKQERGYNQAELLSRHLGKGYGLDTENLLLRIKHTKPQAELTFKQRKKNVNNIFRIDSCCINNLPQNVILIDDVWTTGSTLKNAGLLLKKAGVKSVWAITLAR